MEKELTKREIIEGDYKYPKDSITLIPTYHSIERLQEREINNLPSVVVISKDNIYSGKTRNGKNLHSVVIRLRQNIKWLFLCFNPNDGGLKTVWYRDANIYKGKSRKKNIR